MSWITEQEKKALEDLQVDFEKSLIWGESMDMNAQKRIAQDSLQSAMSSGDIDLKLYMKCVKLLETNQLDNIKLAVNIINARLG